MAASVQPGAYRVLPFSARDVLDNGRSWSLPGFFQSLAMDWTNRHILDLINSEL